MKLNELKTEFEKKRVITYNAQGNKAVYHWRNVQQISGNIYRGETIHEEYNEHCELFVFYDGLPVGLCIGSARIDYTIDEIVEMTVRNKIDTLENYKTAIESRIANNGHFRFTEVEFSKYIDPNYESQMLESRKNYRINRDRIDRERQEKRDAEDQAYIEQENKDAQQKVDQAISMIKSGNCTLDNFDVVIYKTRYHATSYSIINYLARKYGVNIPIKTQGWINEKLAKIVLEDGQCVRCSFYKKKGARCSTKIFDYMTQLAQVIKNSDNADNKEEI